MNTFNTRANNVMKIKSKTESIMDKLSFLLWCLSGASMFIMLCVAFEIISFSDWPF